MAYDGRYLADENTFKRYAYTALETHFESLASFEEYYAVLPSDATKDDFLRISTFYLFLVKQGYWHVTVDKSNPDIDYLTNSYKIVALFSLVESLSKEKHQDFYEWLCTQNGPTTFPISDQSALRKLYDEYKISFGSIRRCVAFFDRLPPHRKTALCNAIHLNGKPLSSVKEAAEFLYNIRSKFVHEGRLALQLSYSTVLSRSRKKVTTRTDLSIKELCEVFEEGVLAYFRQVIT